MQFPLPVVTFYGSPDFLKVDVIRATAILLSRDCDFDKRTSDLVLLTDLRPISEITPDTRGNVQKNKMRHTFYIPAHENFPESYINLRRIARVPKEFLSMANRIASLDDTARLALQRQIAIFFGHS